MNPIKESTRKHGHLKPKRKLFVNFIDAALLPKTVRRNQPSLRRQAILNAVQTNWTPGDVCVTNFKIGNIKVPDDMAEINDDYDASDDIDLDPIHLDDRRIEEEMKRRPDSKKKGNADPSKLL